MTKKLTISTRAPQEIDKKEIKQITKQIIYEIGDLQKVLYAQAKYGLLIILQGIDASGKDSTVGTVFKGINPLGCDVKPFKAPNEVERSYDYLWRVHKVVPPKGKIHIFNRSHYEDILVPKVEQYLSNEDLEKRFHHINNFERLLEDTGTIILKFYLHISKEEQRKRLIDRKTNPRKHWKHSDADWDAASKWDKYMEVYEEIFTKCNEPDWHIIPADQKWYKDHLIAKAILAKIKSLDLEYPPLQSQI